jgi:photosystem II stability/assembly factor-like uncharacterized protein
MNYIFKALIAFTLLQSYIFSQSGWQVVPSGTTNSLQSIHFADYDTGYVVGDVGTVLKSVDGGLIWQSLQTPVTKDLNDLFVFNGSTVLAVGDSGRMIFTIDGGAYWYIGIYNLTEDLYSVSFSGNNGICGGSSQTILYGDFYETGITWYTAQTGFFGGGFWAAYSLTPQIGFVAGENSIFQPLFGKTTDTGATWNFTAFYLNNNEGRATGIDFTDINIGYISASVWDGTGAIAKTTDGGTNWNSIIFSNPLWSVDFPISGASQVGYAVGDAGTIFKTFDAGTSWQQQQSGISQKLNKTYFLDPEFGFAVGENGIILKTIDGGLPVELISFSAEVKAHNIILSWRTATETNNQGFEIERMNSGGIFEMIGFVDGSGTTTESKAYSFVDAKLNAGTFTYRLKQIDFDGKFSYSNTVEVEIVIPSTFMLEQNYPNPFNPNTTIRFSIPVETDVRLNVFNTLGQEVAEIINSRLKEGYHEIDFDATNLTSGIYFYRLEADKFVEVKKMILLK